MTYGLPDHEIQALLSVFKQFPEVEEVVLFGSRAMGNFGPGSDIDLAVKGANLTFDRYLHLLVALEDLDLLYKIDLVNFHRLSQPDLRNHIGRVGISLYQRDASPSVL
jgi:uncharacterized protein